MTTMIKSLLGGAATLLDIGGSMPKNRIQLPPEIVDAAAIRSDWEAVGGDIKGALVQIKKGSPTIRIVIND